MENLTENIKKAFEFKNEGLYKEAIDCFYKAFTIDNDSVEIMSELAHLYSKLNQLDRAIDFCEQILAKVPDDFETRFFISKLYRKYSDYNKAEQNLIILFNKEQEIIKTTEELFLILDRNNKPEKIIELYNLKENVLKSSVIYCYVGNAYLKIKNEVKAEEYFKKAFETDKSNAEAGSRVAEILYKDGLYEETETLLNNLLKYSENDRVYYILAEICYVKSDYDQAINYYVLALKLNDKDALYYYKLGGLFVQKGFFKEAEECLNKAVYIEPDNLLYNYTLAYFYFISEKYSVAKHIIDDILARDKNYKEALTLKLQILLKENNLAQAGTIVESLSKVEQKDEGIYYSFALYYASLNMWNKAANNIKQAILLNENSCDYNYELAGYYFKQKMFDKTKNVCEKIISINNKYINAYILISKAFLALNDYENADINIEKALKLDMNIPEIYYLKGIILEKNNEKISAIENYKTAVLMNPCQVEYYDAVACGYYSINDYESAYNYYKEASELDVVNPKYRYYIAKCCEKIGRTEEAIVNYSVARRLSPFTIEYVEDYAKILFQNKKRKQAISLLKTAMKNFSSEEKQRLKKLMIGIR